MKDYTISLRGLLVKVKKRIALIQDDAKKNRALMIVSVLKKIINTFDAKDNIYLPRKLKLKISSRDISFSSLFSLYLLFESPNKINEILNYYENRFEFNELIKEASFRTLVENNVDACLKINGELLCFSNQEIDKKLKLIRCYFETPPKSIFAINFDFKLKENSYETIRINFFKELEKYVLGSDKKYLNDMFLNHQLKNWIRFELPSNVIAELFYRLQIHNVIDNSTSASYIAKWLSDRIKTLKKGTKSVFITPSWQYLENVINKNEKKPPTGDRILTDILPLINS